MITEEQIKKLKPGDPVIVEATFCKLDCEGDVVSVTKCTSRGKRVNGAFFTATSCVSLPPEKPKYDPTRPFKKGDRAQVVERNGRNLTCFPVGRIKMGDIVTVAENETGDVFIKVLTEDGHEMMAPWFMLELVTTAEELEPYMMKELKDSFIVTLNDTSLVSKFLKASHPHAKAAAEAERDRLNAEWRKEHEND